jgi:glutathione S-transferase
MSLKLFYLSKSPYARKVRVLAYEAGLADRIELVSVLAGLTPLHVDEQLLERNPLGKVPALVTGDGMTLFDSRVICEYLDTLHAGPRFFPVDGKARWRALRRQALADGVLDAAVLNRYELVLRPEHYRWAQWTTAQMEKVRRTLDVFESEGIALDDAVDIGVIAMGCALAYLDFRYPDEDWRSRRPGLAKWFEQFAKRPSMRTTAPD